MIPGDIVAYEKGGRITHVSTVTGVDSRGYPLVTCHNTDRDLRFLAVPGRKTRHSRRSARLRFTKRRSLSLPTRPLSSPVCLAGKRLRFKCSWRRRRMISRTQRSTCIFRCTSFGEGDPSRKPMCEPENPETVGSHL